MFQPGEVRRGSADAEDLLPGLIWVLRGGLRVRGGPQAVDGRVLLPSVRPPQARAQVRNEAVVLVIFTIFFIYDPLMCVWPSKCYVSLIK